MSRHVTTLATLRCGTLLSKDEYKDFLREFQFSDEEAALLDRMQSEPLESILQEAKRNPALAYTLLNCVEEWGSA